MKDLIKQFQKDFREHLENTFNASNKTDKIEKLSETENTVLDYITSYQKEFSLNPREIIKETNYILNEFGESKIEYIK